MVEAESGKAGLQQWRQWLVSYYPLKDGGDRVLGVNVMVQEITDRKRAEELPARLGQIAQVSEPVCAAERVSHSH